MWDLIVSFPDHCLSFYLGWCAIDIIIRSSDNDRKMKKFMILPYLMQFPWQHQMHN